MELMDYLHIARKYWRSIVAIVLLPVICAAAFSLLSERTYTAASSILLSVGGVANTAGELSVGSTYAQNQAQSLAIVATAPIVLQPVIDSLGLDTTPEKLAKSVTVSVPAYTAVLNLAVAGGDAAQTARIASALEEQIVAAVKQLTPSSADGRNLLMATVIRPAVAPTSPTSPRTGQNLGLGLLIGIMLAAAQAVLRTVLPRASTPRSPSGVTPTPAVIGSTKLDPPPEGSLSTPGES